MKECLDTLVISQKFNRSYNYVVFFVVFYKLQHENFSPRSIPFLVQFAKVSRPHKLKTLPLKSMKSFGAIVILRTHFLFEKIFFGGARTLLLSRLLVKFIHSIRILTSFLVYDLIGLASFFGCLHCQRVT